MTHNAKIRSESKDNEIYITSSDKDTLKTISVVFRDSIVEISGYAMDVSGDVDICYSRIIMDVDVFNELIKQVTEL